MLTEEILPNNWYYQVKNDWHDGDVVLVTKVELRPVKNAKRNPNLSPYIVWHKHIIGNNFGKEKFIGTTGILRPATEKEISQALFSLL